MSVYNRIERAVCGLFGHGEPESYVSKTDIGDYLGMRCCYCKSTLTFEDDKPYIGWRPKGQTFWTLI